MGDGFTRYERFFSRPPAIVVEWHDDVTDAVGWLAIDSLRGGAAGGGTRMTANGSKSEAVFLAKTMGVKFRVCGPEIGGGKSVIRFNPGAHPDKKQGVLERWYRHVRPYLRECYGTGGDVNVDEISEATRFARECAGVQHPQEGICRGHMSRVDGEPVEPKVRRILEGCEKAVTIPELPGPRSGGWMIADVITGFGVARAAETYYRLRARPLRGARVIVEGFGAVGAFAAYYLEKLGAVLVAASTKGPDGFRVLVNEKGIDARALLLAREGTSLPPPGTLGVRASATGDEIFLAKGDIFIPAATSHTLDARRLDQLHAAGVTVWSCGANNPFAFQTGDDISRRVAEMLVLQRRADDTFEIIPDFVANCGMARTFAYLMSKGASTSADAIFADAAASIDHACEAILKGHAEQRGLLRRGYEVFLPEQGTGE